MHRLGLALSGGGFRATLYHLGVVRFLRDAEILPKITHMTTVSGGSILGAHLALNWEKYCGSPVEFEEAADQIVRFVQLDVRNRIVRRFPLTALVNLARRILLQSSHRRLTRPGLLERYYEKFLYGDTCLFQLPESPQLHVLATNLSEGCLCSFSRDGLLRQRRTPGRSDRFERVTMGLATIPMAVAASSAFPGFFPPLQLTGWEVGAKPGEFDRQAFTDGGVFDNLGVRMFRCMEQSWMRDTSQLCREEFLDLEAAAEAIRGADQLPEENPIRRLAEMLAAEMGQKPPAPEDPDWEARAEQFIDAMWEVITTRNLYRDPSFQNLVLENPEAQTLLQYQRTARRDAEWSDHVWLNRLLVAAALRQVVGRDCLRPAQRGFEMILVSDAGSEFQVTSGGRSGGLIRTALRSSNILMDRVWQLEMENFQDSPGFVFASIGQVVPPSQDPSAPNPEVQRQAARIRTDLDYFSPLEVRSLVQHGYCVARKACRSRPGYFGKELPDDPPWDPFPAKAPPSRGPGAKAERPDGRIVKAARTLRDAAGRRTIGTVLNLRDWPTYVWLALLVVLFVSVPYQFYQVNRRAAQSQMVLEAISKTSPLYETILERLQHGPVKSLVGLPFTDVPTPPPPDFRGFAVITDARIFDLRELSKRSSGDRRLYQLTRVRVRRTQEGSDNTQLRVQRLLRTKEVTLSCRNTRLQPTLTRSKQPDGNYLWQLALDFSHVPIGQDIDFVVESFMSSEAVSQTANEGRFDFVIHAETGLAKVWVLMPTSRSYTSFEISKYELGKPESARTVVPTDKVELPLGSLVTFQLVTPEANYRYECRWTWRE